ncbi:MAG: DegT/DnrJ/EryC1/StrS family aminotransferase [Rhodoferax sp.]|uniref:DegT/DnrJ/EryC1/StrS family aminotransferase n=1 Tax=Rhodoferax sp. TaxID=50421 RepID=UPI0027272BC3|nr:DegT/DnrJ/EryC1/StrS family aminotransferase [Rhodoferax sp.]MDO8450893.1 DegT/DnrJ/EryC1/StrS family aminotransferase [Rhodoferax sp.]
MTYPIPRLPVLDWATFSGTKLSAIPCLLTHPETEFTNSGRASILLALEMLGIGPGDKVLVPTYHCPTMIAPIVARGAQAVFYPLDGNGAPKMDWITQEDTRGVRALLVAHFFGLPQPLAGVRQWCDQQGVRLIEDCAHALFGASDDRAIGCWGDLAIASLTKFLPVPEGGCLVNNTVPGVSPMLHRPDATNQVKAGFDIVHCGVNHGRLKGLGPLVRGLFRFLGMFKKKNLHHDRPADPSPTDGFTIDIAQSHQALTHASRWIAQHAPRDRIVARRRENYNFFAHALSGQAGLHPLRSSLPDSCAPYVFPLWVDQPDPGYAELRRLGFPVSRWDRLWPTVATIEGDCGIKWSHHILQLACHQDLTLKELQQMVDTLKQIYAPNETS